MNSQTLIKIEPYMFGLGDVHRAVGLLKTLLIPHPGIPTSNLKPTNEFDKNTQFAIASVQKSKGLEQTGRMDFSTWLALGAEMNPLQIKSLFAADVTAQNLLGLGYVLKHPERNEVSNTLFEIAVIHVR